MIELHGDIKKENEPKFKEYCKSNDIMIELLADVHINKQLYLHYIVHSPSNQANNFLVYCKELK